MDYKLQSKDEYTQLLRANGITTWNAALDFIRKTPYGRNTNRADFSLVITENKGTCSSKHAFLKEIAIRNTIPNIDLIIGIYKMNESNTDIASILTEHKIDYIPEAHCYLRSNHQTIDVTTTHSEFEKLHNDILVEVGIEAQQVIDYKITFHQNFIRKWIQEHNIAYSFQEIWTIREKCIQQLST